MVVILHVFCHLEQKATSSATVVACALLASTPRYPPNPGCCHYPLLLSLPLFNSCPLPFAWLHLFRLIHRLHGRCPYGISTYLQYLLISDTGYIYILALPGGWQLEGLLLSHSCVPIGLLLFVINLNHWIGNSLTCSGFLGRYLPWGLGFQPGR